MRDQGLLLSKSGLFVIECIFIIGLHFTMNAKGILLSKLGPFVISAFSFLANILPCKAVKMHKNHDIAFLHFARILNNLIQYVCIALQMAITHMHFVAFSANLDCTSVAVTQCCRTNKMPGILSQSQAGKRRASCLSHLYCVLIGNLTVTAWTPQHPTFFREAYTFQSTTEADFQLKMQHT